MSIGTLLVESVIKRVSYLSVKLLGTINASDTEYDLFKSSEALFI